MGINSMAYASGRMLTEDGGYINVADALGGTPTGQTANINHYAPLSGRMIKEDGTVVNIAESIGSGGGAGATAEQLAQIAQNTVDITELKSDLTGKEPLHKVLSATLVTGDTVLTFTDDSITDDTLIYIYTDAWGVQPSAVEQSGNVLTLTFDTQSADLGVKLEVR